MIRLEENVMPQPKATLFRRLFGVSCIARQAERLRNSRWALGQCSPTTLGLAALLGGSEKGTEKRLSKWRGRTLLRKGV